ncbi:MAG: ribosomal protein S18-alanine N-acetyltransferase [Bacilli bacterium]|nr:ribosomal protein S18-alanine N-acetyltransferase [Bacilli bacterium]
MRYLDTEIRQMAEEDIPAVLAIEKLSFRDPWKAEDMLNEITNNPYSNFWVIELSNPSLNIKQICGFCDWWVTFDSATICQIAVHPDVRQMHLGSQMMEEIIATARAKKVRTITLEVRASNKAAIKFYGKFGFYVSHVKDGYYLDGEDALYMILEVKDNG